MHAGTACMREGAHLIAKSVRACMRAWAWSGAWSWVGRRRLAWAGTDDRRASGQPGERRWRAEVNQQRGLAAPPTSSLACKAHPVCKVHNTIIRVSPPVSQRIPAYGSVSHTARYPTQIDIPHNSVSRADLKSCSLPDADADFLAVCQPHLHAPTSAPGLDPPPSHLHRDWAHPCPHLHRDWAHPCHICTGTGPTPAHICTGTGPTPAHICTGTGPTPAHICTGTGPTPCPHLHRDRPHWI
jgi:hypothetical protein